jgi:DNA-binding MarR family transcriptional regulator
MDPHQLPSLQMVFKKTAKLHYQTLHERLSVKDVFPGQPPLLFALSRQDGLSQKELAERMQITPATVNVMIGRMERTGLLVRRMHEADQRVSQVFLTEKGRAVHTDIREEMGKLEELIFGGFTSEEKDAFRAFLLRMYENLDGGKEPACES